MRRGHTIENYMKRIDTIRDSQRGIALTTDIIVGFPGETIEDFEATKSLIQYCQYDGAYIFRYSVRNGTPSSKSNDDVPFIEKTRRFLELEKLQKTLQKNSLAKCVDKTLEVLVERQSVKNKDEITGHTRCHRVVNFKGDSDLLGKLINVKITESKNNTLYGIIHKIS